MLYNLSRAAIETLGESGLRTVSIGKDGQLVRVLSSFDLFLLDHDTSLTPSIKQHGYWEAWVSSWLTRWLRPGMTFLDVGANCGYYTMLAKTIVGPYGHVVAYEPNPEYASPLLETRAANDSKFLLRPVALGNEAKDVVDLGFPDHLMGGASVVIPYKGTVYPVRMTTLDAEMRNLTFWRADVIKIDVEAAEELVWEGAQVLLHDPSRHITLLLEWTPGAYSEHFAYDLAAWGDLALVGYDGGEEPISAQQLNDLPEMRMIVVRKR